MEKLTIAILAVHIELMQFELYFRLKKSLFMVQLYFLIHRNILTWLMKLAPGFPLGTY